MKTVEDVFRRSRPAIVAALTRTFGPARLDLVESAVQDAFLRSMTEWTVGVPANPEGWLHRVAKNLVLDALRHERIASDKEEGLRLFLEDWSEPADEVGAALKGETLDDQIKMIFVACHPCNTVPSQVALALRTLCGLEVPAIARALFVTEDAIEKRLVLARRRLRDENVSFELPSAEELDARLEVVLRVLYLTFNEAYWVTSGPDLVQEDVALEAIRLVSLLAGHPATTRADVLALLALMYFHASRFMARIDARNVPIPLPEQNRSLWNREAIDAGLRALGASAGGKSASSYHFEAAIAAVHATSASHEATDWARIVAFYDQLLVVNTSPVARLGRAIAISFRDGPADGLRELATLADHPTLVELGAFHAARADVLTKLGRSDEAREAFAKALERSTNEHERRYLAERLARL